MMQKKAPTLKKAQSIRYSANFNYELSRIIGAYAYFLTNRQLVRAFWNMNTAIEHVIADLVPDRIFKTFTTEDVNKRLSESEREDLKPWLEHLLDGKVRKMLFLRYRVLFQSLYGTGPSLDGKFSYLDLRPKVRPRPEDDIVYINRRVRFIDVWGNYDYEYLTNKIRFVTVENTHNEAGFPIQIERPSFSFNDPNIHKLMTNAVPMVYWTEEAREVENRLIPVCKLLEIIMAFFLHMEGYKISRGRPAGAGGSGGAFPDEGDLEDSADGGAGDSFDEDEDDVDYEDEDD